VLTTLDFLVIGAYLIGIAAFGILSRGKQQSATDYFLGGRDLPWWAVSFSVVATETSTLTVIGVPAITYGGTFTFLQITIGYILGRIVVAAFFLPRYFRGSMSTAYEFLGQRFGDGMRATAAGTFMITRLLADGVRLFATAIPLRVIAVSMGYEDVSYGLIIAAIAIVTVAYTLVGGIRAVVWMDAVQMGLYVGGGIVAAALLLGEVPATWWAEAGETGKLALFDFGIGESLSAWLTTPYVFWTAVLGGGIFAMASHGTDHLIVQRLLTCRDEIDAKKALIASGFLVMAQFALFLFVGLLLWAHYGGQTPAELGLANGNEIFPFYLIEGLPPGLSGLILAGIIAAAMSTLSSSLNSLASSSLFDLYQRLGGRPLSEGRTLALSRWLTLAWGVIFIGSAMLFTESTGPVVELGLSIASFTYGGLLGIFLLGLLNKRPDQRDGVIAFLVSIVLLFVIAKGVWYSPAEGWTFQLLLQGSLEGYSPIGWPWYVAIGSAITLLIGSLLALRHPAPPQAVSTVAP
jgi:SSS family transporter